MLTSMKLYACCAVNCTKANLNIFQGEGGGGLGAPVLDPPSLDKVLKERDNTKSHKDAFQKALLCAIRKCIVLPFLKSVIRGNMRHYNAFFAILRLL